MTATRETPYLETDSPDPLTPRPGVFADHPDGWRLYAHYIASEARAINPRVVFIGDSITQAWRSEGLTEWHARFAEMPSANLGIGGDRTYNVLWRINDGALDGISPEMVVLLVGVNNLWTEVDYWGPERVSSGIAAVVEAIKRACPDARVLVLGILPTQSDPEHPLRSTVRTVNGYSAGIISTADGSVQFADIGEVFVEPDGTISSEIMPDGCHLSPQGYKIFGDAIAPLIDRILAGNAHNEL